MATDAERDAPAQPHPSDIGGVTAEYRRFLSTWGAHCGAPKSVFQGNLNVVVQAELKAAGTDVMQYANGLMKTVNRNRRALDGLTHDLITFLSEHDCVTEGHIGEGCPVGAGLLERLHRARSVLDLDALNPA